MARIREILSYLKSIPDHYEVLYGTVLDVKHLVRQSLFVLEDNVLPWIASGSNHCQ